ncbi:MAG: SOS response-associated peptidase [Opitutales bacterium]|jgi:putative SOS response-associated peptidase YedK
MCGRVTQFGPWAGVVSDLGLTAPVVAPRYNVTPGTPAVTVLSEGGALRTESVAWGFLPARPAAGGRVEGHANARAEGAYDRPTFRESAGLRRCLVPVDGYYEWSVEGRVRVPHYFRAADGGPLALAGLWSDAADGRGGLRRTFCLLTVAPNREAAAVHSRMPVLLLGAARRAWLSERPFSPDDFASFTRTAPDGSLGCHRVGPEVNRADAEGPGLVLPLGSAPAQGDFLSDLLG